MARGIPATFDDVAAAVVDMLDRHGPLTEAELCSALAGSELGAGAADVVEDVLLSDALPLVFPLVDERYAYLPSLLDGRVFTHRVTAAEIAYDVVPVAPDLDVVAVMHDTAPYDRVDGKIVEQVFADLDAELLTERGIPVEVVDEDGALLLPAGTLRHRRLSDGDLVAFRVTRDGLTVQRVDADAASSAIADRLADLLDAHEPEQLACLVLTACADDPELLRAPTLPIGELIETAGLARQGEWVGPPGFDFAGWRLEERIADLEEVYGLTADEALAVVALTRMYEQIAELVEAASSDLESIVGALRAEPEPHAEPRRQTVRSLLPLLADPQVAQAVLGESIGAGREGAAALGLFAETLEELAPRQARVALRWLRGKAYERLGDTTNAIAAYEAAEAVNPDWSPVLYDLARVASDRGEAERGWALLQRAGARPNDELRRVLQAHQPTPRTDIGRNQPCWCGSGRKYKHCHLRREQLPLADRADWLYRKALMHLQDGPWRTEILALARLRTVHWDSPTSMLSGLADPLVLDTMLFEGDVLQNFLTERGDLLPDDERLLAEQWLLSDRSVYEIESTRSDGYQVRDLRTGDRHDVIGAAPTGAGFCCARLLPVGATVRAFAGTEPVAMGEHEQLMTLLDNSPLPVDLIEFLSRRFAPPVVQNTEGEPLVLCHTTLTVPNPAALIADLDRIYDRDEPAQRWSEHVTTHGMDRIRATLELTGNQLRVETNSDTRMTRVLDVLADLHPTPAIRSQTRQPATKISKTAHGGGVTPIDPTDPGMAAALEEFVRKYEDNWLDEPIPALAGRTPRQAATDPTRRDDLIRLLDSFPPADRPGAMNPDRLRNALDLL